MDIFYPLQLFADLITDTIFRLGVENYWRGVLNFFIYDTLKILILMFLISYIMAVINHFLPMDKVKRMLSKRRLFGFDYFMAAILGVVTPFCSCSSIPLFIGFVKAGIPLGVVFAFLISSPLVNEASLALFPALFGWQVTIVYNLVGILIAVIGGFVLQKMNLEKYLNPKLFPKDISCPDASGDFASLPETTLSKAPLPKLLKTWTGEAWRTSKSIAIYVVIGVGVGALIHGFIPDELVIRLLGNRKWWEIPLATIIGVPLYANSLSVIPIARVLIDKGANIGTVLAFMTATVTLSLPQILMLKKVMKWQLLLAFYGVVTIGIIAMGYLFNFLF